MKPPRASRVEGLDPSGTRAPINRRLDGSGLIEGAVAPRPAIPMDAMRSDSASSERRGGALLPRCYGAIRSSDMD